MPWEEDTTTINSVEKVEEVLFAELSEVANEVKLRTGVKEWSAEESIEDGESLGWDIWKKEDEFEDLTNGEQLEELEELLEEEELSEEEL